jgi:hypothetical protein
MKKVFIYLLILFSIMPSVAYGEEIYITNGLNYLKSKQDDSGKITSGFSSPSQWSAIAFMANGIEPTTIKKSTNSLYDFLSTDIPTNDTATEWETRILAIIAVNGNPTNFNGTNYVAHLETFYNNGQIGDTCSLNDDIFGLLALIASGDTAQMQIKQDTLNFLIQKQDSTDGGFGFSAPGCAWYSSSADMTGAGVQSLVAAKENGLTNSGLDDAISKAKNYLLANQDADGGFGYFGSSDTDTTGWVLMGLNALGMVQSQEALKAQTYLLSQQSSSDGGFMAFDWGANAFASNATTTAQSLIGLLGKSWILHVYTPQATSSAQITTTPSITNTPTPTLTITPTPTPGLTSVDQKTVLYQTLTITTTPSPKKITKLPTTTKKTPSQNVLGGTASTNTNQSNKTTTPNKSQTVTVLSAASKNPIFLFIAIAACSIAVYFWVKRKKKIVSIRAF